MTIREMAELVANDVSNGEIKVEFDIQMRPRAWDMLQSENAFELGKIK